MEVSWIFISASAFNLLPCIALVEVYEEKQASHTYTVGKGRSILIVLLGNFGYSSSKTINQKSTPESFWKVSCNVDSEIVSMNFSYSVSVKPIDLTWSFEKYWFTELCLSYQCWQISLYNIEKACLLIPPLTESYKFLKTGKRPRSWQLTQVFQNSDFCFEAQNLSLATDAGSCFPWSDRLGLFICEKTPAKFPSLNNHGLSVFLSSSSGIHGKKQPARLIAQQMHVFLLERPSDLGAQRCLVHSFHFVTWSIHIKRTCTPELKFNAIY